MHAPRCWLGCLSYGLDSAAADVACSRLDPVLASWNWSLSRDPDLGQLNGHLPWPAPPDRASAWARAQAAEVLWCARGGHGLLELTPLLTQLGPGRGPLVIGYSDVTVLHAAWLRQGRGPSCYAAMPGTTGGLGSRALASLETLLAGQPWLCDARSDPEVRVLRAGTASGPMFAGCLRLLAALCGGPLQPRLGGHLLCIEDIDERPYAIDRDLRQLRLAGVLDGVSALIGGRFPEQYSEASAQIHGRDQVLRHHADELGIPCLSGLPFGHEDDPLSLPCGGWGTLDAGTHGDWQLRFGFHGPPLAELCPCPTSICH